MGLDQAVKPGCSHPGQGMPAAQAKSAGLSDPKLPARPVHRPRALSPPATGRVLALSWLIRNQLLSQVPHTLKV